MRAFSSGAVALTGVEAISNAVPTFKRPEARNASRTLIAMVAILGTFFLGISVLAQNLKPTLNEHETILSILGRAVFGDGVLYFVLQAATATILILAANTAYNAFPSVCSIIARDGFLPRQLFNRGDRLVFSNGILFLSLGACGLLVAFGGVTTALIPLYAVGRVHQLHAVAGRHGPPPPAGAGAGLAAGGRHQQPSGRWPPASSSSWWWSPSSPSAPGCRWWSSR